MVTSAGVAKREMPADWILWQNFPNPFNPTTVFSYQVRVVSDVRLAVYDLLGRQVAVLVNERKEPGNYQVEFDATGLASGTYIYRLTAGGYVQTRKMVLVKQLPQTKLRIHQSGPSAAKESALLSQIKVSTIRAP
jgi:hypothetical protein